MAKKAIAKIVKETAKKKAAPKKAAPKKAAPKKAAPKKTTPKKATPKKATPKKSKFAAKSQVRNKTAAPFAPKSNTRAKVTGALAGTALVIAGGTAAGKAIKDRRKRRATEAAPVTFGAAFKEARKKGEGTKFTWNGKSYTAVTKDDLKRKGYDANELRQYANNKGKARRPIKRVGQGIKKVLLGKDKKFGGDKGLIDFIRKPKRKTATSKTPAQRMGPGKKKVGGGTTKKYKAGGLATKGLGKAYINSKR